MKTSRDFSDGHLWYSVIRRPASSTFTSVQRVSCCFSLSLCTMLTSIMFYGIPTDPSEQTMDLGRTQFHITSFYMKKNDQDEFDVRFPPFVWNIWRKPLIQFAFNFLKTVVSFMENCWLFSQTKKERTCSLLPFSYSLCFQVILSLPGNSSWLESRAHSLCFPSTSLLLASSETLAHGRLVVASAKQQDQIPLTRLPSQRLPPNL